MLGTFDLATANNQEQRFTAGVDDQFKREQFAEQANRDLMGDANITVLEKDGQSFLARSFVPPAARSLAVLIVLESDADLLNKNFASSLQMSLGLAGWPVMLVSMDGLNQMPEEQRAKSSRRIVDVSIGELQAQGIEEIAMLVSPFSMFLAYAASNQEFSLVRHLIFTDLEWEHMLPLPETDALVRLQKQGVSLLDLVPPGNNKQRLGRRKQMLEQAGYASDYQMMRIPLLADRTQQALFAKRLRVWLKQKSSS